MSRLLSRWQPPDAQGCTQSITPERAGWGHVGFAVFELEAGRQLTLPAVSEERCLVLVAGRASITAPTARFANIGERMSPFERKNRGRYTSRPAKPCRYRPRPGLSWRCAPRPAKVPGRPG